MFITRLVTGNKAEALNVFPEILFKAGFEPINYNLVMVKSNICGIYYPDSQLIEGTLKFFEPRAKRIIIGETNSTVRTPEEQFRRLGILNVSKRFGKVDAMNLMKDEILDLGVPSPHAKSHLPIPKSVHYCDLLVNIAKVGTHSNAMLTCALKNLFGLIAEKRKFSVYHPLGVDKVIADVAKMVRCDLNIIDVNGQVIVGLDALAVDIFACRFVGLDPMNVEYLRLVAKDRHLRLEDVVGQLDVIKLSN